MNGPQKDALAAEYALGTLTPNVYARVTARSRTDPELARAIADWQRLLAPLTERLAEREADAGLWPRVAAQLPSQIALRHDEPPATVASWWQSLWLWRSWSLAASAAAVILSITPAAPPSPLGTSEHDVTSVRAPVATGVSGEPESSVERRSADASTAALGNEPLELSVGERAPGTAPPSAPSPAAAAAPQAAPQPSVAPVAQTPVVAPADQAIADASGTGPEVAKVDDIRGASRTSTRTRGQSDSGGAPTSVLSDSKGVAAYLIKADEDTAELRIHALSSALPPSGRDYELWAIDDSGGAPRSLGLIARAASGSALPLTSRLQRAVRNATLLAVSIEPQGGSPTGAPTGDVIFSGPLVRI